MCSECNLSLIINQLPVGEVELERERAKELKLGATQLQSNETQHVVMKQ